MEPVLLVMSFKVVDRLFVVAVHVLPFAVTLFQER